MQTVHNSLSFRFEITTNNETDHYMHIFSLFFFFFVSHISPIILHVYSYIFLNRFLLVFFNKVFQPASLWFIEHEQYFFKMSSNNFRCLSATEILCEYFCSFWYHCSVFHVAVSFFPFSFFGLVCLLVLFLFFELPVGKNDLLHGRTILLIGFKLVFDPFCVVCNNNTS